MNKATSILEFHLRRLETFDPRRHFVALSTGTFGEIGGWNVFACVNAAIKKHASTVDSIVAVNTASHPSFPSLFIFL